MTNVRTTITAMLSTIETTATSATKIVATAGRSIDMLNRYVSEHQRKQALRIALDQSNYRASILNEHALRCAQEEEKIERELTANPALAKLFKSNYDRLDQALKEAETTL